MSNPNRYAPQTAYGLFPEQNGMNMPVNPAEMAQHGEHGDQAYWQRQQTRAESALNATDQQIATIDRRIDGAAARTDRTMADHEVYDAAHQMNDNYKRRAALEGHKTKQAPRRNKAARYVEHGADAPDKFKHTSAELDALNLAAQERVYGEFVDPRTGNTVVNKGVTNKIEQIRTGKAVGVEAKDKVAHEKLMRQTFGTGAERAKTADEYQKDIESSVANGAELSQAELMADLRLTDKQGVREMTAKLITEEGMDPAAAQKKAQAQYDRLDAARRKYVTDHNIMTIDEYHHARQVDKARRAQRAQQAAQSAPGAAPQVDRDPDSPFNPDNQARTRAERDAVAVDPQVVDAAIKAKSDWLEKLNKRTHQGFKIFGRVKEGDVTTAYGEYLAAQKALIDAWDISARNEGWSDSQVADARLRYNVEMAYAANAELQTLEEATAKSSRFGRIWSKFGGADAATGSRVNGDDASKGNKAKGAVIAGTALVVGAIAGAASRREHGWVAASMGAVTGAGVALGQVQRLRETVLGSPAGHPNDPSALVTQLRADRRANSIDGVLARRQEQGMASPDQGQLLAEFNDMGEENWNRIKKRATKAAVIGGVAATAAGIIMSEVADHMHLPAPDFIDGGPGEGDNDAKTEEQQAPPTPPEDPNKGKEVVDAVARGDGMENTIQDVYGGTGDQAHKAFEAAKAAGVLGDVEGLKKMDVGGGYGFARPGEVTIGEKANAFFTNWYAKH